MPTLSELLLDRILCPHCEQHSDIPGSVVKFQWGKIPYQYRLGEHIVWLRDSAGNVLPPFTAIEKKNLFGDHYEWNCGESKFQDVYVFDADPNVASFQCSKCEKSFEFLIVEIRQSVIMQVHALTNENVKTLLDDIRGADIIIINNDGKLTPRPDWNDVPLS